MSSPARRPLADKSAPPSRQRLGPRRTRPAGRRPVTPVTVQKSVPLAEHDRWSTMGTERTVLIAVHTLTSLLRLEDITMLIEDDPRVQLMYTQVPDQLGNGVEQRLRELQVRVVPWQEIGERPYDLAIAASLHQMSEVPALHRFAAPHGAGYNKFWPDWAAAGDRQVYGLDRWSLLDEQGQPIFDTIMVPHNDHLATLNRQCPEALPYAIVAGDPCYDRLCLSMAARDAYRAKFGVRNAQVLVAVSSTWGRRSLLGSQRDLLLRLTSELPANHRVIATLHPAVWAEHGSRQVRTWLRDVRAAGVDLVDVGEDWRALVAAADVAIADHSSLAVYAASVGVPLLLSHFAAEEIDPRSVMAELAGLSPQLCPATPLCNQLDDARLARTAQMKVASERVSAAKGLSAGIVRQTLYTALNLPEPELPAGWPAAPMPRLVRDVADLC